MTHSVERFNLRVYALIVRDGQVLLSDEQINDFAFTKFPGGGVEPGEGLIDALKRELMEEGGIVPESMTHFYTTDFFQASAFNPREQVVAVYYKVEAPIGWHEFSSDQSSPGKNHTVRLYYTPLHKLQTSQLNFPIDQKVLKLLQGGN